MQPKPKKGKLAVTERVITDMRTRRKAGKKKYGRVLETHNGRDSLQDAYEEALDLCQYLKQKILEQEDAMQPCTTCKDKIRKLTQERDFYRAVTEGTKAALKEATSARVSARTGARCRCDYPGVDSHYANCPAYVGEERV